MGRFISTVESVAGLSGSVPAGGTANGLFANLAASNASGYKFRRMIFGVRAGAGVPTSQQITIAAVRVTARGTATTTNPLRATNPNLLQTSSLTGLDVAWGAVPTPAVAWTGPYFWEVSFNSQAGADLPFEDPEDLACAAGLGNGIAFINVANALPANHILTMSLTSEE